jgi:hypothetical protein
MDTCHFAGRTNLRDAHPNIRNVRFLSDYCRQTRYDE